jgi:outer membrane protein TolC
VYTKNQYEAVATIPLGNGQTKTATITPEYQRDAVFTVSVPLVDVGAWQRIRAANRTTEAADARATATLRDVEGSVGKAYFQVLASESVHASAQRSLETQKKNVAFVETRRAAGVASELDARRAQAEVERAKQDVAEAVYQVTTARRALETASGLSPEPGAPPLADDLRAEAPLAELLSVPEDALPDVIAAQRETKAQETVARATRAGLLPTLSVAGTERFTNATGFSGQTSSYQIVATAQVKLDGSVYVQARSQDAAAVAARAREEKARRAAQDRIFNAHARVTAQLDKARSARSQVAASELAADLARQRYQAGTANFIDVSIAERDLFAADVARIQADADLAYARLDLRLAAGRRAEDAR